MVTITTKHYSEKDAELEANALENIKCREGVCLSTEPKPTDWANVIRIQIKRLVNTLATTEAHATIPCVNRDMV